MGTESVRDYDADWPGRTRSCKCSDYEQFRVLAVI